MHARRDQWAGILAGPVDAPEKLAVAYPQREATPGLAAMHRASKFMGKVVRFEAGGVELRGQSGLVRAFKATPGAFSVDGQAVTLVRARPTSPAGASSGPAVTASGSLAVAGHRARVARAGRILVEGVHDAELVEQVWGDDLRVEGVVVERLDGIDYLASAIRELRPGPARRLGVLVDHLVPGSKEARIAAEVAHPDVLVTGTPYVDVWQAVKPAVVGIEAWPAVPMGIEWKAGVCAALGVDDVRAMWRRIRGSVRTYADLEPSLVGAVERLIDFVTDET